MNKTDTIAAIATPSGRGGVGIVRISGPASRDIAQHLLGHLPKIRYAEYLPFKNANGEILDSGIALYFQKPHSFTGEDVLELQAHGGPVVLDLLLKEVIAQGARLARAGEFSEQAFLNNKMDLAQAEAVADLIAADSEAAARAAVRSLQGEFSQHIHALVDAIIQLRLYVEAALDFPEEEVDFISDGRIATQLNALQQQLQTIFQSARQGCLLREGMTLVIAGKPNAGKSSLLNQLAGRDAAIVTDIPGTTRDILREHIQIDGLPLHIIDTAGLRESHDPVEQEGIRRAWQQIEKADRILLMLDANDPQHQHLDIENKLPAPIGITRIFNKIDVSGKSPEMQSSINGADIYLSAKTGAGMELLRQHLKHIMGYEQNTQGQFLARRRHLEALQNADQSLQAAQHCLHALRAGELLAEELRRAQESLNTITGEFTADDLLGKIFSSFCIGK